MASLFTRRKSLPTGLLFIFLSLWMRSASAFPTASNSNSSPNSRIHRSDKVCGVEVDSSGPHQVFCRDHPRRRKQERQKHGRRELTSFRLWSSAGVDDSNEADDSNDDDLSAVASSPAQGVLAFLVTSYRRYTDLCRRRPFLTSSITAGVLAASGDILSQSIQAGHGLFQSSITVGTTVGVTAASSFNWIRWRTFLLTGLLFEGPWVSFWYQGLWRLGRWMEASKMKASSRLQVLVQTVIDQTVGVSIFFPMYFLVYEIIGAVVAGRGMYNIYRAV
jgi:hypothetical protein